MNSLTNQEYLELCQKLVDQQYDAVDIDNYNKGINKMEWIPAEPESKKRVRQDTGIIDLTTIHSSKIKEQLLLKTNFRIGKFKIKINRYINNHYLIPKESPTIIENNIVTIWEQRNRTPNGIPCNIDCALYLNTDDRFTGRPWLTHFKYKNISDNMSIDTIVEMVRWLRCVEKLSAFL